MGVDRRDLRFEIPLAILRFPATTGETETEIEIETETDA